jgi:hypothetical protein
LGDRRDASGGRGRFLGLGLLGAFQAELALGKQDYAMQAEIPMRRVTAIRCYPSGERDDPDQRVLNVLEWEIAAMPQAAGDASSALASSAHFRQSWRLASRAETSPDERPVIRRLRR